MTRTLRATAGLLATAAALTLNAPAANADRQAGPRPGHAPLQRVLDQAVADGMPGAIAHVRDARGSWFGTAGVADTTTGRKRRQQDHFRAGSTTKTFIAVVLLQLAAERRLSLDDTVDEWLPGVVRGNGHDGTKITIRQLLNQTSGIFPYTSDADMAVKQWTPAFLQSRYDSYRPGDLVKIAMRNPPSFAPGKGWGYSNTNYTLAGMIIEKVTGRSYAQEITRRLIRPLGLTQTHLPGEHTTLPRPHARHYIKLPLGDPAAKTYDLTDMNPSWAGAAGGIISTTGDLHTFYRALLSGRLLPPAQHQQMFTTVSTQGVPWIDNTAYGLGVFAQKLSCGVTVWGNGGRIHGSWTYAMGSRDGEHLVVTNLNGDWGNPISTLTKQMEAEMCPTGTP
ncbi:serine hydrolase domain-containing protein [Bailinhaonella thermotolerans]|uniref:Class A beta-lactamase-related serine hydrolase n=1 Tax=Bailinhaonella thermotolerans TaxID=1070861 RepID=A0A3A4BUM9_9ACTN|nr:serine hydrolase domain-containing protein [Bailinhaonella thermotolerans]RJL35288.1 class A beta-lactamase-related serine hydrolase [Bailinhaonella thermotolerans]